MHTAPKTTNECLTIRLIAAIGVFIGLIMTSYLEVRHLAIMEHREPRPAPQLFQGETITNNAGKSCFLGYVTPHHALTASDCFSDGETVYAQRQSQAKSKWLRTDENAQRIVGTVRIATGSRVAVIHRPERFDAGAVNALAPTVVDMPPLLVRWCACRPREPASVSAGLS